MNLQCPLPVNIKSHITLAHGGGGKLMTDLIDQVFTAGFGDQVTSRHDGVVMPVDQGRIAFTTDSYVVRPLFFPGGDIGKLAVCGTVNDLAVCGARPLMLSAGFILEEGLPIETLWEIVQSMRKAADDVGIRIATGDTKVVEKGKGDGLYINTSGIGILDHDLDINPEAVEPGDAVLLSGDVGRHGAAIMVQREGLSFESTLESDCAPLTDIVEGLISAGLDIHCMRDLTRGGLISALVEIAEAADVHIHVSDRAVAVQEDVRGVCEILGLDPLYVANEGRMIVIVPDSERETALACMRTRPLSRNAVCIGHVCDDKPGLVTRESEIGVTRIADMLSGEQLPRIC